jgi:hypothetical protein
MTDERIDNGMQPGGGFDDDRLLALALGLDDDPELLAAAEGDAELAARMAAMRADVAHISAQVGAAIPTPDHGYTDLSGDRWSALEEFFEPPASAAPRRGRRWWRVVVPVTALVALALAVGIVAIDRGGIGSSSTSSGSSAEVARSTDDAAQPATAQSYGAGTGAEARSETPAQRLVEELDRFAVIVLARAREASGALQRFAVVRIFKGDAPNVVELEVDGHPADRGRLHLLMLDPVASTGEGSGSPEPIPSLGTAKDAQGLPGKPLTVAYTYDGEPTVVREFAAGTDPSSVSLPIP